MPDSAEQLQRIYLAGFELQTFERYPKCIGVIRDNCIALLVPGVDGLQILGTPGWRMGEVMGVSDGKGGPASVSGQERDRGDHAGEAGELAEVSRRTFGTAARAELVRHLPVLSCSLIQVRMVGTTACP